MPIGAWAARHPEREERATILREWNATAHPLRRPACRAVCGAGGKAPDAVAVIFEQEQLSYGELDRRANALAHHLRARGVGPETVVGLCLARSPEMIVAMLAILKAGGAYLPLDPDYPSGASPSCWRMPARACWSRMAPALDRLARLRTRLTARARASCGSMPMRQPSRRARDRPCRGARSAAPRLCHLHLRLHRNAEGSRGHPCRHPNPAAAQIERFAITGQARVLQFASLSFDAAVSEIATALLSGAALLLPGPERSARCAGKPAARAERHPCHPAAGAAGRVVRWSAADDPGCRRRGMSPGCGRALVEGAGR